MPESLKTKHELPERPSGLNLLTRLGLVMTYFQSKVNDDNGEKNRGKIRSVRRQAVKINNISGKLMQQNNRKVLV